MAHVPFGDIIAQSDSIFKLTLLAAKRVAELSNGAPKLVAMHSSEKFSTIALEEIRQGKVKYRVKDEKK